MLETSAATQERWVRWHDRLLVAAACTLCVNPLWKVAEIQFLELIYAIDIAIVSIWLLLHPHAIRVFRPFFRIGVNWAVFAVACLLLSFMALRGSFYIGPTVSWLKGPIMTTVSRLVELALDVYAMVYLACRCREDRSLCRFALWFYCGIGFAGAVWGWVKVVQHLLGLGGGFRITGFYVEGGPYGVYLVTVIMAVVALYQQKWIRRRNYFLAMPFLLVTLLASQSKAALLEIVVYVMIVVFLRMKPLKALAVALAVSLAGAVTFQALDLTNAALAYVKIADQYRTLSLIRQNDGNLVVGRAAGVFLTPKMIATHPLAGIGLGNYPIVRDDPQYRRGSLIVGASIDSPSLGLIDYVVELGFPLFLFMTWVQIVPAIQLLRGGAKTGVVALVLASPISLWFGAHLNLTYPWIAAAIAMAIFYSDHDAKGRALPGAAPHTPATLLSPA